MRLAWFSPWPPQPSGVAGCSADVVPALAARGCGVDVFVDARLVAAAVRADDDPPVPGAVRVQSAHDFVWRAGRHQYDLVVYQVGNSRLHAYIWPYLFRWPGLVVLHDSRLHHARGSAQLQKGEAAAYREEFAWNHPGASRDAAELAVAGFPGAYYYLWPMTRAVLAASRLVACHSRGAAAELAASQPATPIAHIALGHGRHAPVPAAVRERRRAALGLDEAHVAFGVFGALTAEKRIPQILHAFRTTRRHLPHTRLVLAGAFDPGLDVQTLIRTQALEADVRLILAPEAAVFDELIAAVDVALCLRWPTALETSGPWLRALAAGRATVTIDLAHQTHVPAIDPRGWQSLVGADDGSDESTGIGPSAEPITVAIDILDEAHSLRLAMARLATDAPLRAALGRRARAYWEREHSIARMVDGYLRVIAQAAVTPDPTAALPARLRPDPLTHARMLLDGFGEASCVLH